MAIRIPIISEFDERGITRAGKEFASLETVGQKTGYALDKAFVPAIATLGAITAGLGLATKAAMSDQKAQVLLARQLQVTTKATEAQVKANEEFITTLSRATAVADDDLRPAMASLVRSTGDLSSAQRALSLSVDIAAATGRDLESVSLAVGKAMNGTTTALAKLDPSLKGVIDKSMSASEIMSVLEGRFGGAGEAAANTAEGGMKNLSIQMGELQESIGAALIPILEKLLPYFIDGAQFAQEHADVIVKLIGIVGTFAAAIVTANVAMKAYNTLQTVTKVANMALGDSFTYAAGSKASGLGFFSAAAAIAIITVTELYGLLNDKSAMKELTLSFRQAGQAIAATAVFIANTIYNAFAVVYNGIIQLTNKAIDGLNLLNPFKDIPRLDEIGYNPINQPSFFYETPTTGAGATGFTRADAPAFNPAGGAIIAPDVAPSAGGGGGGGGGGISKDMQRIANMPTIISAPTVSNPGAMFGIQERMANINYNIEVTGGLATSSEIGQEIVNALRSFNRTNGPAQIAVSSY